MRKITLENGFSRIGMKRIVFACVFFLTQAVMCVVSAQRVYDVTKYGAKGDGMTDDAAAIQTAVDRCSAEGGGRVLLPSGHIFLCGPLQLRSNIDLHIEANATLKCAPDESKYVLSAFGENRGEGMMWIYADDAENVSVSGRGVIDGSGVDFMGRELSDSYELKPLNGAFDPRPHVMTMIGVRKLSVRDVTICDGAYWTIHLAGCDDVVITGISLLNNLKIRNGDGIDIDHSRRVRISDCLIESGDDCVCLKNRREYERFGPCGDVVVTNCVMTSRSCAIKIGSENMDSISNVLFDNCVIRASNRGLGIQNRDEGTVTNVVFSNMVVECQYWSDVWWGKSEPIYVTSYPRAVGNHKDAGWRFPKGATSGRCGEVSEIYFNNVKCYSENGCFVGGDEPGKVNNVYFDNVDLTLRRNTSHTGGVYDKRPCAGEGFVTGKTYGLYVENMETVYTDKFRVRLQKSYNAESYAGDFYAK